MVIGNGLVANVFSKYKNNQEVVIFASGVSNSNEEDNLNFKREEELLLKTINENSNKLIVYFSSCDVIYSEKIDKKYYFHKLNMEQLIKQNAKHYYLFRLPQIIGYSSNKNSLINYFIDSLKQNRKIFILKDAYRNLIDIDDIFSIVDSIIEENLHKNKMYNIINKNYYSILDILNTIEKIFNCSANKEMVEGGFRPLYIDDKLYDKFNINFSDDYIENSIKKHY